MKVNITEKKTNLIKVAAAYTVIYVVWGTTYLGLRFAVETIPPFVMAGTRFTVAGLLFCIWFYIRESKKPSLADWRKASVMGISMIIIGHGCFSWAQQYVPSGFSSLIAATIPIWMIILSWAQSRNNRPDKLTLLGVSLGLIGVVLLSGLDSEILIYKDNYSISVILGVFILTIGTIGWVIGSLYSRNTKTSVSLQFTVGMQFLVGGLALLIIGLLQGEFTQISFNNVSFLSISSLSYLIIFGTLIAYPTYIWLLRVSSPAKVGTYAFFNPLVALFLGGLFADEIVTIKMLAGTILILISISLVNSSWFRKKNVNLIFTKSRKKHDSKNLARDCSKA